MYLNAISYYKLSRYFRTNSMSFFSRIIDSLTFFMFNSIIPSSAKIGDGTFCSHRGIAVVIHRNAVIGKNCIIGTSVVIGGKGKDIGGAPEIGDNVYIGTGSKILGPIKIGSNVTIGANSVVLTDVPEGVTVAGIPSRII